MSERDFKYLQINWRGGKDWQSVRTAGRLMFSWRCSIGCAASPSIFLSRDIFSNFSSFFYFLRNRVFVARTRRRPFNNSTMGGGPRFPFPKWVRGYLAP
jgi:hypothetical protein